jgi:hypothetical protein
VSAEPTITLPRLPNETGKAYAARQAYILMGAGRSLDKVSRECTKSLPLLKRWSARYGWVEHARRYDDICGQLAAVAAADAYRRELESYRERYGAVGRSLYQVAGRLLVVLNQQIDTLELAPADLTTIARALVVAADLEALALRLRELLEASGKTLQCEHCSARSSSLF